MKKWLIGILVVLCLAGVGGWYWNKQGQDETVYRLTRIERGDLMATISATGVVEPEEVVDVGAQIAGKINTFGQDPSDPTKLVDYRSQVEVGTILAQIDDSLYRSDVEQAQAQLDSAKVAVQRAQADLGQMNAKLAQTQADWKRAETGGTAAGLSQSDIDLYRANYEVAKANLAVGQASVAQAQANVAQSEAAVRRAQTNLSYCTIKSPVKGTIIDRRVNIGQTVVASLNAPSLFLIAKDLKRMQVWASVNEADIGNIHPNQRVTYTVDAFPLRTFKGTVGKVRLNANMTQNIVTYTVEVVTDNSDLKLYPYMTANLLFEVDRRQGVLTVPNASLRWMPREAQVAPEDRKMLEELSSNGNGLASPPDKSSTTAPAESARADGPRQTRGLIWTPAGQFVKPIEVKVGLSNGITTEIQADNLNEGTEIIIGEEVKGNSADTAARNPFIPQFGRGGRRG